LNEPNKTAESKSYMWVLATTQASVPIVLYHYSASRSGDIPKTLLPDFIGALMVEGYEGYAAICNENQLTRLGSEYARAHDSVNISSLIEIAMSNKLEPYGYLKRLFTLLTQAKSVDYIDSLRP
jgi:hypothetical protein